MGKLDFSGINKIACECFKEYPEEQDSLLQAGFTVVDVPTPFDTPQEEPQPSPARKRKKRSKVKTLFADHTGCRDYSKLYKIVSEFHRLHSLPRVNWEYWQEHIPGVDEPPEEEHMYWEKTTEDFSRAVSAGGEDPFLQALLSAVMHELEMEYRAIRQEAHKNRL